MTIRVFIKRRAQFSTLLSANNSLTKNRYFRLMALAMTEVLCTIPISAYGVHLNLTSTSIKPWKGWADAHFDYGRVDLIPSEIWRGNRKIEISIELTRWTIPFCAFVFFGFFGFATEAMKSYRKAFCAIAKPFDMAFHTSPKKGFTTYVISELFRWLSTSGSRLGFSAKVVSTPIKLTPLFVPSLPGYSASNSKYGSLYSFTAAPSSYTSIVCTPSLEKYPPCAEGPKLDTAFTSYPSPTLTIHDPVYPPLAHQV